MRNRSRQRCSAATAATAAALAGLAAIALGCSGGEAGSAADAPATREPAPVSATPTTARAYEPDLSPATCHDPALPTTRVSCWTLVLPEDRAAPTERQVELPVLRVAPTTPSAGVAPVVVLHGGPGGSALRDWLLWTNALDDLDAELVLYDQRGSGEAVPRLDCPEIAAATRDALADAADAAAERADLAEATRTCGDRLTDAGVGLDHYDTPTSTQDLEDLRVALGTDQLRLVGQSYGTRLALDYLRTHPDRVSTLVLDSVDPPAPPEGGSATAQPRDAVERLLQACEDDPACAAAHPTMRSTLERILDAFDAAPRHVIAHPEGGTPIELTVTGDDLYAGLVAAMYDSDAIALAPSLLSALASEDPSVLRAVASQALASLDGTSWGTQLSVECADRSSAPSPALTGRATTLGLLSPISHCANWPVEPVGTEFREPLQPDDPPPALVLAGELDPVTPAGVSRRVAEELGAEIFVVPRGGHAPALNDPCALRTLQGFLGDPGSAVPDCALDPRPRPFA